MHIASESLVLTGFRSIFEGWYTWADLIWCAIFFVSGSMMAADNRFAESANKHGWICLTLWMVGFSAAGLLVLVLGYDL